MSIIRYEPKGLLNRLQNELNDFFGPRAGFSSLFQDSQETFGSEWTPRIDIKEEESRYVITADVPGVDPRDIQVALEGDVLSIRGERKSEKEEKEAQYRRRECSWGSFERRFLLPELADGDRITATGRNGVLTVELARKPAARPRTVKVEVKD